MNAAFETTLVRSDDIGLAFLRQVLPKQGYFAAAIKQPGKKGLRHEFASTIDDLAATIAGADRDGLEVYFACASYREARNDPPGTPAGQRVLGRTKRNVLVIKSLWLDLDAGANKPYRDVLEARQALAALCRTAKLPIPVCVVSGSGLHVYWPLRVPLDRTTWERYASGLKRLCERNGLNADPARTADASSVLRVPGTHNRKYDKPRLVECDPKFLEIEPYALDRFEILAANAEPSSPASRGREIAIQYWRGANASAQPALSFDHGRCTRGPGRSFSRFWRRDRQPMWAAPAIAG